jgi:putative ABC transport system substrate-binding protein
MAKLPTIGFLGTGSRSSWQPWTDAFVERLRQLGWIEERTVTIEYRSAEGSGERFAEIAAEFVRLKVDIIVTSGAAGPAVKQATSTIPIVLGLANDPVGEGLVTSLRRPGGNITGLSLQAPDLAGKRLGLLHEILPDVRRLAILVDITYPAAVLEMREAQTTARSLGIEFVTLEIRRADDIAPALEAHKSAADALFVGGGPLMTTNRLRINTLASCWAPNDCHFKGERRSGCFDVLRTTLSGPVPTRRRLCRYDFAGGKAGRTPNRAADQVRTSHQPQDC